MNVKFLLILLIVTGATATTANPLASASRRERPDSVLNRCLRTLSMGRWGGTPYSESVPMSPYVWAQEGVATVDVVKMPIHRDSNPTTLELEFIFPHPSRLESYAELFGENYLGFMFTTAFAIGGLKESPHASIRLGLQEYHIQMNSFLRTNYVDRLRALLDSRSDVQTYDSIQHFPVGARAAMTRYYDLRTDPDRLLQTFGIRSEFSPSGTGVLEDQRLAVEDCGVFSNLSFRLPQWHGLVPGLAQAVSELGLKLPEEVIQRMDPVEIRRHKTDFVLSPRRIATVVWTSEKDLTPQRRLEMYKRFFKRTQMASIHDIGINDIRITHTETFDDRTNNLTD